MKNSTIKHKIGECIDCNNGKTITLYAGGRCRYHYWKHRDKVKQNKKPLSERSIQGTGEKKMFQEIWKTREHISFLSRKGLNVYDGTKFWYSCFAHVLPKGKYPKLKINPENIVLLTPEEHRLLDQGTEDQRKKYQQENYYADWDKIFKLKDKLKLKYKNL